MKKYYFSALILLSAVLLAGCLNKTKVLGTEEAKQVAEKYINENLLQGGNKATIKEVKEENGLFKLKVELTGGQHVDSYMSLDGSMFFPQAMNIAETANEKAKQDDQQKAAESQSKENLPKTDKPSVEIFVMSHCPYGTQIEKGIIPAVEALGNKIDFQLKFCDYAMHGEKEVKEQLNQVCIIKEQKAQLFPYLKCFLKDGDGEKCLKEAKINTAKLSACVKKTDNEFEITKKLNDKSKWETGNFPPFDVYKKDNEKYNVQGSPALVVNGTQVQSSRDAKSLLDTICAGFKNQPEECKKELTSAAPSAGFGEGTGESSSGGCAN